MEFDKKKAKTQPYLVKYDDGCARRVAVAALSPAAPARAAFSLFFCCAGRN